MELGPEYEKLVTFQQCVEYFVENLPDPPSPEDAKQAAWEIARAIAPNLLTPEEEQEFNEYAAEAIEDIIHNRPRGSWGMIVYDYLPQAWAQFGY